jgi:hypothetical protein
MEPMIHDIPTTLDSEQQRTISQWVLKTAMVADAGRARAVARFYRKEECESLANGKISGHTLVWLGRSSQSGFHIEGTEVWFNESEVLKAGHGCVTTIVVGHLAIQVLTVRFAEAIDENARVACRIGPWNELLVQIFPSAGTLSWPPASSFTNDGTGLSILDLHDRWRIGAEKT